MAKSGVLLTAFGGPDSLDAVRPFMCNLMGREPSDELVQAVCRRYMAIGGSSPLPEIASGIAAQLGETLSAAGEIIPVSVGMQYSNPTIPDALASLKSFGVERVVVVSLSPFESKVAHGAARRAIEAAAAELGGLEIVEAPLLSTVDGFATYLAVSAATAITEIEPNEDAIVVFTAHSLPVSDLSEDDPYEKGLREVAEKVVETLGMAAGAPDAGSELFSEFRAYGAAKEPRPWFLVYQSKGRKPGDWLGPDLDQLIEAAADSPVRALVVVPIGFVTDHMETLYDLDIEAADKAMLADLEFVRGPVPNDDESFISSVAEAVQPLL